MNRKIATAVVAAVVALWLSAMAASADLEFATTHGPGTGQTEKPRAITVDRSNGNVYVADTGNNRVDVFEADGDFVRAFGWGVADGTTNALQVCTATCFKGISGSGVGQFSAADLDRGSIAVDNDPASPTFRQVFVGSSRVQRFTAAGTFVSAFNTGLSGQMAVGPSGDVYVADTPNHLKRFSSSGVLLVDLALLPAGLGGLSGFTVDSAGDFYLASGAETGAVRKYDSTGTLLNTLNPSFNIQALATDAADNLLVSDLSGVDHTAQYSPVGTQLRVVYGNAERRLISLSSYPNVTGDFFGLEDFEGTTTPNRIVHIPIHPPGPVVLPFSGFTATGTNATATSNTKATVNAQVNPEGKATTFRVEYVDEETYDDEGFTSALKTPELAVDSDFELHDVSAGIGCPNPASEAGKPGSKCLLPETTYHYRVVATNPDGTSTGPEGEPFTTKPPLEIVATFATDVVTSSATLHGEVNPLGVPATGYFQYVDEETCEEDLKAFGPGHCFDHATEIPSSTPIDLGSGEAPRSAVAQLTLLTPATTYRYRLVATNAFTTQISTEQKIHTYALPSPPKTDCPNQAFRTAALPDCRAYELVSPADKAGGDIAPLLDANLEQAARDGESITYSSYRAFADPLSAPFTSQYLARRSDTGWQSESIAPPREGASFYGNVYRTANQYKLFSEDLCSAWLTTETEPLLAPQAIPGFPNAYRRQNCGPQDGIYEALSTALPKEAEPKQIDPKPQAFSADGSLSVFTAEGKLTPDGIICTKAEGYFCTRQLYLSQAGKLRLICILPDGTPSGNACSAGFVRGPGGTVAQRSDDAYHAVSEDGSRVFWTNLTATLSGAGPIYVRVNPNQGQSKIEAGKCTEAAKACTLTVSATFAHFRTASADGSVAIYTEGEFEGALHEFDVDAALAEEPGADTEIAGNAISVLGTSEDASRMYFVSPEALTGDENSEGDKAQVGKPNLYLREAVPGGGVGSFAFIGTLVGGDAAASINGSPILRNSRVTPDDNHLAFVSAAPLTGYDNKDAASGQPDMEVYLYDADEEELRCVSCNPSGARPVGGDLSQGVSNWTAARIPTWTNGVHFSGILSDDGGRLFFESVDPLVLRDTNGAIDVYEWQRASSDGECGQSGADLFSPRAGGCISLVSSGKSPQHSQLVDASTDGEDAFFMTQSSLLPQDTGLIDIYDARVQGGFPQPLAPPAACEGEACQGTPAAPNDPTPASSAFEGAGNVIEGSKPRCRKGTRTVRKAGKTRCVKRKAKSKRHNRTNHNRRTGR